MAYGESMKCALISVKRDERLENVKLVLDVLEKTKDMDLIIFPGWTLTDVDQLNKVIGKLSKPHPTLVLEVYKKSTKPKNYLDSEGYYVIKNGKPVISARQQPFYLSSQINEENGREYLDELENDRLFETGDKRVRLIICGENNILKNEQSKHNEVSCRLEDEESKIKMKSILDDTNLFINPAHTPMGNLGKMKKRWEFLSKDDRAALFVTNEQSHKPNLEKKSLRYAFINGQEIPLEKGSSDKRYWISYVDIP